MSNRIGSWPGTTIDTHDVLPPYLLISVEWHGVDPLTPWNVTRINGPPTLPHDRCSAGHNPLASVVTSVARNYGSHRASGTDRASPHRRERRRVRIHVRGRRAARAVPPRFPRYRPGGGRRREDARRRQRHDRRHRGRGPLPAPRANRRGQHADPGVPLMSTKHSVPAPVLPDGLVVVVKEECATCHMV